MEHIPGGGEKKIFDEKPRWQARSKIGSLDNINHQPLGGRVRITNNKLNWGYKSKVSGRSNQAEEHSGNTRRELKNIFVQITLSMLSVYPKCIIKWTVFG